MKNKSTKMIIYVSGLVDIMLVMNRVKEIKENHPETSVCIRVTVV